MTTADPWAGSPRESWLRRAGAAVRGAVSASRRKTLVTAAQAVVATIKGRFTLAQLAGGACASTGVFELWGLGVGLLVTGLAVLTASTVLESRS